MPSFLFLLFLFIFLVHDVVLGLEVVHVGFHNTHTFYPVLFYRLERHPVVATVDNGDEFRHLLERRRDS